MGHLGANISFRHRCASALVHPATVVAVALLLLNDVAFKSMWPGSVVTGKLSDLAWVVFASPLLAFLLSFALGGSKRSERAALLASYAGLPILYAAFNTFESVHDVILRGLSIASGGTAGSPLDPTDSFVIPFGLGIALWVWRGNVASLESLRFRCRLVVLGVAGLASVATSYPDPDVGIDAVGISDEGTIHGRSGGRSEYRSEDGGVSWARDSDHPGQVEWGRESVEVPRGGYRIEGPDIVLSAPDGLAEVAYSTAYMQEQGNLWVQKHATSGLDVREIATAPRNIVYDERTGNIIAAMGVQGVVVGTPDGTWTRQAVGRYSPVDFSFSGKTRLLLSNAGFWTAVSALSLSMTGAGRVVSQVRRRDLPFLPAVPLAALALLIGVPVLLAATGHERLLEWVVFVGLGLAGSFVLALVGGLSPLGSCRKRAG